MDTDNGRVLNAGNWGPKDNIRLEEGSMKKFKSEYKRCYRHFKFLPTSNDDLTDSQDDLAELRTEIRPHNFLKLEGDLEYRPQYRDIFIPYSIEPQERFHGPQTNLHLEGPIDTRTEKQEKYVPFQSLPRAKLIRRSTNLQREGEFMVKSSEMHSQFVRHEAKKADITRRPTSLHMEGDMAVTSETTDKFVEFLKETRERPEIIRASNNLKLEGSMDVLTESNEQYVPFEIPKRIPLAKPSTNLQLEGPMDTQSEQHDKYIPFNLQEKSPFVRRHTNLQLEGEMEIKSENKEQYVPHNLEQRPTLAKRDTNLTLEGEMMIQTEKQEKYVPFELSSRKIIQKRPTNLQLEGEILTQTEKSEKHVPFDVQKRAPLAKKDTNLQLQGDLSMTPEYRQEFIHYNVKKAQPNRPVDNIGVHIDDNIVTSKKKDNFFEEYMKPYRSSLLSHKENFIPHKMEKTPSKKPKEEGAIDLTTETNSKLREHERTGHLEVDKNKASFPRKAVRHAEEISAQEVRQKRTRSHAQAGSLKSEGELVNTAEYRSSYVDFPRERPIVRKPEGNLKTEGQVSHLSEKSSAYVAHGLVSRPALARREDSLKMDDGDGADSGISEPTAPGGRRFECQPEYRKAYNDYLQRENLARKPRKLIKEVETETASLSKIPLPKTKRQGSKSPTTKPNTASSTKSRSVSPGDRRRRRPVPHTPQPQRLLVPEKGDFTPRRPSSIFGPKTGRWYPRTVSPEPEKMRHCSDDEWECGHHVRRRCSPCCGCRRCHSRSISRWESDCGHHDYHCDRPSPRRSPSPSRRLWSRGRDLPPDPPQIHILNPSSHPPPSILRTEEKPASFVVLTDKVEINNNRLSDVSRGGGGGSCSKEQKWMPPWYDPPM